MRPLTRRRLYWTARGVFVSDRAQVKAFDAVFFSIFGGPERDQPFEPDEAPEAATVRDERPPADEGDAAGATGLSSRAQRRRPTTSRTPSTYRWRWPATRRSSRARPSTRSTREELARLYRLMSRLELATPRRRTRRYERGRHGRQIDMRRTLRAGLRTGGEPMPPRGGAGGGSRAGGS